MKPGDKSAPGSLGSGVKQGRLPGTPRPSEQCLLSLTPYHHGGWGVAVRAVAATDIWLVFEIQRSQKEAAVAREHMKWESFYLLLSVSIVASLA